MFPDKRDNHEDFMSTGNGVNGSKHVVVNQQSHYTPIHHK